MKIQLKSSLLKAVFLLSLTALLASSVGTAFAARETGVEETVLQAIAPNDDFDSATTVTNLPYRLTNLNFEATDVGDDPVASACKLKSGQQTVWYKFTPVKNTLVHMDTIGSNYDTYMAVWTGTRGSLTHVACNDDANGTTFASAINITLKAGTAYYIEVAQFNGNTPDAAPTKAVNSAGTEAGIKHVFRLVRLISKVYKSSGVYDGYIVESNETSNVGRVKDSVLQTIRLGDDERKRQWVGILSFNTALIPDGAIVNYAAVKVKRSGTLHPYNLFSAMGGLKVDIRKPYFGQTAGLVVSDFQANASRTAVGTFNPAAKSGWYSAKLIYASFAFVNKKGTTQLRLRFRKDDDNDAFADYFRFYSGNSGDVNKPILVVRYYIP